ncbi:hypothetical protein ACV6CB_002388 [Clostridium perfringens]|nr:hypothetical protein [Clostridium perfringens]MDK0779225.1 hypothetical protein [Clostridium perfringens]MDM0755032.1 hypothetical protein [Clostridium perfringens]
MKYFERLEKFIKENNIKAIREKEVRQDLERLGYMAKKNTWQKNMENNEVDYFELKDLNRKLNTLGFKKDARFKVWHKDKEGLAILGNIYGNKIYELGAERYCLDDIDDYLDDPRIKLEQNYLHYKMFEEIEKFSSERGLSFESGLEYIILDYLKKERTQDTYLKTLLEDLEEQEGYYNAEEKQYLISLYKKDKEAFREKLYCEHLESFYIDTLISKGLTKSEIEDLKKVDNDPEFLAGCYVRSLKHKKITLDLVMKD